MKNDAWLKDRVAYLKGLKSRNEQQELLVLLAEKSNRNAQDDKKLNAIVKPVLEQPKQGRMPQT